MRTTLDIDEALLREAKMRAAEEGTTLTKLVEQALRARLQPRRPAGKRFRLKLMTKTGQAVPGINWDDRDSIYERMEDRT